LQCFGTRECFSGGIPAKSGASLYHIHGSNEPDKIGQAVSSGCIRLTNQDVIDLYNRVRIGATVIVQ
jgi:lipoprotein-anchoring transpeptidase ErfK/SrfK